MISTLFHADITSQGISGYKTIKVLVPYRELENFIKNNKIESVKVCENKYRRDLYLIKMKNSFEEEEE